MVPAESNITHGARNQQRLPQDSRCSHTHPGILFKGIVLEAERADIKNEIPDDGVG